MSATSQHGFHPDAESLSAFVERALSERERAGVLKHLAVCGRCRQVVALASEAANADAASAPVTPRKIAASNAWWKQWRLVWVPTAIVAAFAVASISVYIEQADQRESNLKISTQMPTPAATPTSSPSPTEQTQVEPPAPAAPAQSPAHSAKQAHSAAAEPVPAPAPPAVGAQMPREPGGSDHVQAMREQPPPLSPAGKQQANPGLPTQSTGSAYAPPFPAALEREQKQAEEQRRAQVNTSRVRSFSAMPPPSAVHSANQPAPSTASESVTLAAAPPMETAIDGSAQPDSQLRIQSMLKASIPAKQIHLPSGLAVVSSASTGSLMLAIDKAGTLFLSEGQGDTWERVSKQWKGRAVAVAQLSATDSEAQTAPAAQAETAPSAPSNSSAGSPTPMIFELLNDKGHAWVSTDGRTWTSK